MQYNVTFCPKCRADLEDDARGPCPDCGSTGFTTAMLMPGTLTLGDLGGIVREYGPERPWQEQWYRTRERFKELKRIYQPGAFPGDAAARTAVEDFFHHCLHLGDWLWTDPVSGCEEDEVRDFIKNNRALKICAGLANTSKHRGRDWKGSMNAVVRRVWHNQAADSTVATVEWWLQSQESNRHTVDALELAEGCVAAWKQHLKSHRLRVSDLFSSGEDPH